MQTKNWFANLGLPRVNTRTWTFHTPSWGNVFWNNTRPSSCSLCAGNLTRLVLARLQLKWHTHALGQPWRCAVIVQTTGFQLPFATEHVSRRRIWVEHGWLNSANCERIATVPRNPKLPACIALAQRNAEPIVVIRHRLPDCNTRFFEPSGNMEKENLPCKWHMHVAHKDRYAGVSKALVLHRKVMFLGNLLRWECVSTKHIFQKTNIFKCV